MEKLFYQFGGLPIHPLVVHFAVVLFPLAILSVIASIYSPKYRQKYMRASLFGTFIGFGAVVIAKQSGEQLAANIGTPVEHARYGNLLPYIALAFFISAFLFNRAHVRRSGVDVLGNVTAILGVFSLIGTLVVGHTGAQAVWKGRLPQASATPSATKTPAVSSKKSTSTYTMAMVRKHKTPSSCWTVIKGNVYDLTKWINRHPGGPTFIKQMCGKDGTLDFTSQHGGQSSPAAYLKEFKLGPLG